MYLPIHQKAVTEVPPSAGYSETDWHVLAGFWHPVAVSSEVQDKPVGARLLGVDLVVYRTRDGVCVSRDACPHRGSRLSSGWLDDERTALVCPMHGHHYGADGRCTLVPSMGDGSRIPERMRLQTYLSAERYGFVWACLKPEPKRPLPDWPLLEPVVAPWKRIEIPKGHWKASASRHCENFNDIAHLSWVHMKTFGNRDRPRIEHYDVERTSYGLRMEMPYMEVERGFNDQHAGERLTRYVYELTYPFASHLRVDYDATMTSHFFDIASPVSARETDIYQFDLTNVPGAGPEYAHYQMLTNDEDQPLVEGQTPWQVPLDPAFEVSMPADRFSIQYRRDMVELFGLGSPT
jgi:vanillate O-demethylase monooxygenase subunit